MTRFFVLLSAAIFVFAAAPSDAFAQGPPLGNTIETIRWADNDNDNGGVITVHGDSVLGDGGFVKVEIFNISPSSLHSGPTNGTVMNGGYTLDVGSSFANGNYAAKVTFGGGATVIRGFTVKGTSGNQTITLASSGGTGG